VRVVVRAQEVGAEMNSELEKTVDRTWHTSPWVWIIGAISLVSLLIVLLILSDRKIDS
jgi:ABC-type phosphate transport system auxiliary subunit